MVALPISARGRMRAAAASHAGKVRSHNEDAFALLTERGLLVVSDGMGGHQAGEAASQAVAKALPAMLEQRLGQAAGEEGRTLGVLRDAIVDLSREIREQSAQRPGMEGMGATVVVAWLHGGRAHLAHMGDSRAYLLRSGRLSQLTADHSIIGMLLRAGEISPEEAREHPMRGRVSRYVGMEGLVYPDLRAVALQRGDRLLLCTDGLTGMVDDQAIAALLSEAEGPERACQTLVDAALAAGGVDNVTVVVADWSG